MENTKIVIARDYPKQARWLLLILFITLVCFIVGIAAPIITLNKFILIENTFSIFSGAIELLKEGRLFLFFLITGFSIVLPLLKISVLIRLLSVREYKTTHLEMYLHWMHLFGKWSMLDVFVVAVLVVTVKLGAIASVETHYGLYAFTASVILTMYVTTRVMSLTSQVGNETDKSS